MTARGGQTRVTDGTGQPIPGATPGRIRGGGARVVIARWLYHYALLAAGTFLLGTVAGAAAMATTSPGAVAATAEAFGTPDPFPDRLTTWTIFANNVAALAVVAAGAISLGLTAAVGLLLNGMLLGAVVIAGGLVPTLVLVLPHGILELSAFFVVGGIAYRITWRLVSYLRGVDGRPLTRQEATEAVVLVSLSVVALAVAAWIEANLTAAIARAILGPESVPGTA